MQKTRNADSDLEGKSEDKRQLGIPNIKITFDIHNTLKERRREGVGEFIWLRMWTIGGVLRTRY
jgi:hypothetical protein